MDVCVLDASGEPLEDIRENHGGFGFIVGDDRAIGGIEGLGDVAMVSVGEEWLP